MPRLASLTSQALLGLAAKLTPKMEYLFQLIDPAENPNTFDDSFGAAAVFDGTKFIVSSPYEDIVTGNSADNRGYVYTFDLQGNLLSTIENPNINTAPGTADIFGSKMALVGGNLLIDAGLEDVETNFDNRGAVYLFDPATMTQLSVLNQSPIAPRRYSIGSGIDSSGTAVLVTGTGNSEAYLLDWSDPEIFTGALGNSAAYLSSQIPNPTTPTTDPPVINWTSSAALNDSYIFIQERYINNDPGYPGRVFVLDRSTFNVVYELSNPQTSGSGINNQYGNTLSATNRWLAVGAPSADVETPNFSAGRVYIYDLNTGALAYTITSPNLSYQYFAEKVQWLSDTLLAVGFSSEFPNGKIYLYTVTSSGVVPFATPTIQAPGTQQGWAFGRNWVWMDPYLLVQETSGQSPYMFQLK